MPRLKKIFILSKKTANSILEKEELTDLNSSTLFNNEDKKYILENIQNLKAKKQRKAFYKKIDKETAWKNIYEKIDNKTLVKKFSYIRYIAAASVALFLFMGYYIFTNYNTINQTVIVENNNIVSGSDKAILTLSNGSKVPLTKGRDFKTERLISNGEKLIYDNQNHNSSKIAYNFLTVPKGGQFFIKLSDGSKIWLNSDSKIKYPVSFSKNMTREVELIYGEAYFDITSSKVNNNNGFSVVNQHQNIRVLGTQFNIKAYKEDDHITTTLVEGKVSIKNGDRKKVLLPNYQSIITKGQHSINIIKATNVNHFISWKDGLFTFKEATLKDMMNTLARWYNTNIIFESPQLENLKFTGVLQREDSIINILELISESNNYEVVFKINKNTIIIKKGKD